jgi:hypothetical protein
VIAVGVIAVSAVVAGQLVLVGTAAAAAAHCRLSTAAGGIIKIACDNTQHLDQERLGQPQGANVQVTRLDHELALAETQRNATQRNATQRNATQRNATQRNATQRT